MSSNTQKWNKRLMDLAKHISTWSKDPSTQCGAVIAKQNKIISVGYNGFPAKCNDDENIYLDRSRKYLRVLHAEQNAILSAKQDLKNCTIYVYPFYPCSQCMATIIQSEISTVVTQQPLGGLEIRWLDSNKEALQMAKEAKINIILQN